VPCQHGIVKAKEKTKLMVHKKRAAQVCARKLNSYAMTALKLKTFFGKKLLLTV
jgi:hypothetical protein